MTQLVYLAAPYTKGTDADRLYRAEQATIAAAILMRQFRYVVFSPLTHGHAVAPHLPVKEVASHDFWMRQCLPFVQAAQKLLVLTLPGWKDSRGVQMEIDWARAAGKEIFLIGQTPHPEEILSQSEPLHPLQGMLLYPYTEAIYAE